MLGIEDVQMRPIHPAIKKVWRIYAVITFLAIIALGTPFYIFVVKSNKFATYLLLLGLIIAVFILIKGLVFSDRSWKAWQYGITDTELILTWGVIWRTLRVIPRYGIQHIDINEGPIDRRFGLVQIVIFAAGSVGVVATIPGLTRTEAEELRKYLSNSAITE